MDVRAVVAARNNADWCDLVCRSHGIGTQFDPDVWVAQRRSPPLYPDAVTLREAVDVSAVLRRIDDSAGCSIKDSHAAVDFSGAGFRVLFAAEWIHRPAGPGEAGDWVPVRTPGELRAFGAAHGGGDLFRPALLDDDDVVFLVRRAGGEVVAGAIGNRSREVVGVSNVFSATGGAEEIWAGAADAVAAWFPGLPLVGYEDGAGLEAAHHAGFASVGPLRVWLKE